MSTFYFHVSGFRSIENIVFDEMSSFITLAGANGSGKSNIVDSLKFLGEVINSNLNNAVELFNGKDYLCNKNTQNEFMTFHICIELNGISFAYSTAFNIRNENSIIISESLIIKNTKSGQQEFRKFALDELNKELLDSFNQNNQLLEQREKHAKDLFNTLESIDKKNLKQQFEMQKELLNIQQEIINLKNTIEKQREDLYIQFNSLNDISLLRTISEAAPLVEFLTNIQVYRIDPVRAKYPNSMHISSKLLPDGSNIADILEHYEKDDNFRNELLEWLEMIVPNLSNVMAEKRKNDGSTLLSFQEGENTFPAGLISDGTIYTLCILTAVLSRSTQHGITIIEEPERGIHPQAIGELISLMREKTRHKHTIILTTHSEAVVRNLELDELYLVHKENGATHIQDVKSSGVDKRKIPLDEAWLTNLFDGGLPW